MQHLMGLVRRCVDDYEMIREGDRIAVGVSGGKDSLALLALLAGLQKYYPRHFELTALTIDMGMGMDFGPVAKFCESLGVPFLCIHTDIAHVIFDVRQEKNPCSMCSKMRRGALNDALKQEGFNKLALGHHYDDAVETFFMSLFYEGRLSCFQPVTWMSRMEITQIRPMLYISEEQVKSFSDLHQLPVIHNRCPADTSTKRQEIKELVRELEQKYPNLKTKVFGAMQRLPLPHWEPKELPGRPIQGK